MMIDDRLQSAADELFRELDQLRPPVLPEPNRRPLFVTAGIALAAAATVVGLVLVSDDQPTATDDLPIETLAPAVETPSQRELLQSRIADLEQEIAGLTVQIDALVAQGDQASETELSVLDQRRALAIRDVEDTRAQLAELDVDGADPADRRDLMQSRIAELEQNIADLTVQIDSLLAQGDQASATELQVLQQRQSLAIRDVADARTQLANLEIDEADPADKRALLQGRIADLEQDIADLTALIDAQLARGGQASTTELQVLQQRQSLAIRDVADTRSQLLDLDLVEADSADKRVLLEAQAAGLEQEIEDLTALIDSLLARGDQASLTELQVLQQRQSQAIRDLADIQGQLAEIQG